MRQSFAVGIGGAAGQGVATPGDIFAKIFQPTRAAPERLQRLSIHHSRRPHLSYHSHRPGENLQHGRSDRPADPAQSGHHGPAPAPADGGRRVPLQRRHDQARYTGGRSAALSPAGFQAGRHQPQQGRAEHARDRRSAQHDGHRLSGAGERAGGAVPQEGAGGHRRKRRAWRAPATITPRRTSSLSHGRCP